MTDNAKKLSWKNRFQDMFQIFLRTDPEFIESFW